MIKVTLLLALFALTLCNSEPHEEIQLQGKREFNKCINEMGIDATLEIRDILDYIKNEKNILKVISKVELAIKKGYKGFEDCYSQLLARQNITFNWDKIIKCLTKAGPTAKSVLRLIKAIRAKDYATAKSLIPELIRNGCQLVIDCLK